MSDNHTLVTQSTNNTALAPRSLAEAQLAAAELLVLGIASQNGIFRLPARTMGPNRP